MAIIEIAKIQIRRGDARQLGVVPELSTGEFGLAVAGTLPDSAVPELYIGNQLTDGAAVGGNFRILTEYDRASPTLQGVLYGHTTARTGASTTPNYGNVALGYCAGNLTASGSANIAIGYNTLRHNAYGCGNISVGYCSMTNNTTGTDNVAIGSSSLCNNITGSCNIAIGINALYNNVTGNDSIAIGQNSLYSQVFNNTTATANIAIGTCALYATTTGYGNVAIGQFALTKNDVGYGNVAIGECSLFKNISGSDNIAIGFQSLSTSTIGYSNVAIGSGALTSNVSGNDNVAVGYGTSRCNTIGYGNIALGSFSFSSNISGCNNTVIGLCALSQSMGNANVAVGYGAGSAITTGAFNVILGNNNGTTIAATNCNIILSDGAGNSRIAVDATGSTCITSTVASTGVGNGSLIIGGGSSVNGNLFVASSATILSSGLNALTVTGGGIFGNNLNAPAIYDNANRVVTRVTALAGTGIAITTNITTGTSTSFTVANFGVVSLQGTANQVSVSTSTGSVIVSLPTLISVNTGTFVNVNTTGTTASTSTVTGALIVAGGVGVGGSINVGGNVVTPNRPAFRVIGSTSLLVTGTSIVNFASGAVLDYAQTSAYNTGTGIFTVPVAGLYSVYFNAKSIGTESIATAIVSKTIGSTSTSTVAIWETNGTTSTNHFGASSIVKLNVNDTVFATVTTGTVQFDMNDSWGVSYIG